MSIEPRLHVHEVPRHGWRELFVSLIPVTPVAEDDLAPCFELYLSALRQRGGEVLLEKVLAAPESGDAVEAARLEAWSGAGWASPPPLTRIAGRPCRGGTLAGIQALAAVPESAEFSVRDLGDPAHPWGRALTSPRERRVYLAAMGGLAGAPDAGGEEQTTRLLKLARERLESAGLGYSDVVRTWFYLPHILEWYPEFNAARSRLYRDWGVMEGPPGTALPASTGIQGRREPGEEVLMDLVAIASPDANRQAFTPTHNPRQSEATAYGSSFSRGMTVATDGPRTCWVSGTASIDGEGHTVYVGDSQGQILETLLDVAALLDGQGLSLGDVCQATAYCKRPEDFRRFEEITRLLGLAELPVVPVYGDVCRPDLLFELEVTAVAPAEGD